MADKKKKLQAAWALLLLLWGALPALSGSGGGSGSGSGSGSGTPATDPSTDPDGTDSGTPSPAPSTDPATEPGGEHVPWPEGTPTGGGAGVPAPDESPDGQPVPWPEAPSGDGAGGGLPEPLPDDLPNPERWRSWMPDPETLAARLQAGAAVQVAILLPNKQVAKVAVPAATVVAAGALVAGDGPLPVGDAAAAGLVGPGFLLKHDIQAPQVPSIDVPKTPKFADILPDWAPGGGGGASGGSDGGGGGGGSDPTPRPGVHDPETGSGPEPSDPGSGTDDNVADRDEAAGQPGGGGHAPAPTVGGWP